MKIREFLAPLFLGTAISLGSAGCSGHNVVEPLVLEGPKHSLDFSCLDIPKLSPGDDVEEYVLRNRKFVDSRLKRIFGEGLDNYSITFLDRLPGNGICMSRLSGSKSLISCSRNFRDIPVIKYSERFIDDEVKRRGLYLDPLHSLAHEIGHIYSFGIFTDLLDSGGVHRSHLPIGHSSESILLLEGISEYFVGKFTCDPPLENIEDDIGYNREVRRGFTLERNVFARALVEPILDRLGPRKGVEAILRSPLVEVGELYNRDLFHERIISSVKSGPEVAYSKSLR